MEATINKIVKFMNQEKNFMIGANWTGMWDKMICMGATIITINRGKGFEKAIKMEADTGGHMIYMEPFNIVTEPSQTTMLMIGCDDALYVDKE